ncbi:hypothetical protein JFN87_26590 [Streptomyces bomunensis]|uniref:Uncharacterized protein n=1 Tax=Streptomyces montanisoli TaxID=2798581 RepID=A0A940MJR0_9ACTN|nr:hypothetical protein [Streptomyces montanisoli]
MLANGPGPAGVTKLPHAARNLRAPLCILQSAARAATTTRDIARGPSALGHDH